MNHKRSIQILETLLCGVDPCTGEVLPHEHVCQDIEVIRALQAAVRALKESSAAAVSPPSSKNNRLNAGRPWLDKDNQLLISLYLEDATMEDICRAMKRRPRGVCNQLRFLGFDPDTLRSGNPPAPMQPNNRGKPWTQADHEWLLAAREEGSTITEIADYLGRTPHAIRKRLEVLGLYSGGMTAADEPPPWTDADNKELFRMVDAGCTVAEMAQRFGRTEQAMEARLFYLGLSKKAPKLF